SKLLEASNCRFKERRGFISRFLCLWAACPWAAPLPNLLQLLQKLLPLVAGLGHPARFFRDVALTLHLGIPQRANPGAELPGNAFSSGFQIQDFGFQIAESGHAFEQAKHRACLSRGAASDIQESEQFLICASLKTFSNIV